MISEIGWIGSILLSICGAPQALKCYNQGHAEGVSFIFLLMWLIGEIFTLIYISSKALSMMTFMSPLILNYTLNIIFISVILYYKIIGGNE